jgi:hypothetical protein
MPRISKSGNRGSHGGDEQSNFMLLIRDLGRVAYFPFSGDVITNPNHKSGIRSRVKSLKFDLIRKQGGK